MDKHAWVFQRYGRSYQPVVDSAASLRAAADLDAALWLATVAPVEALRADPALLRCLDADGDGRIRVGEFKEAIRWLFSRLSDPSGVDEASTTLRISALHGEDPAGQALRDVLERIRAGRPEPGPESVTIEETRKIIRSIEARPAGSIGVIVPDAASDEEIRVFLEAILKTTGGGDAGGGRKGVGRADLDRFETAASDYLAWHERGRLPEGSKTTEIRPLGVDTERAAAAIGCVREKIDEYFTLCEAVALGEVLRCEVWPARLDGLPSMLAGAGEFRELMERSPVAEPRPDRILELDGPLNPYYEPVLSAFHTEAAQPLLGHPVARLSDADWRQIKARIQPFLNWQDSRKGVDVAPLGVAWLQACLSDGRAGRVREMIEESLSSGIVLDHVRSAEKLALLQGGLLALANNFICCPDLYHCSRRALFEEGTLIMDGRRFNLAVRVLDRAEHLRSTEKGAMFVLYLQLDHAPSGRTREVAVPVTYGTQGLLEVGKRGVFEDVEGTQWMARVVHLLDRPVSLREAVIEPFVRLGRAITGRIEAITSAAEKRMEQAGTEAVSTVHDTTVGAAPRPAAAPAAPAQPAQLGGALAGGGIALAALGGSMAFMTRTLAGLRWWQVFAGFGGIILAVLVPTIVIAAIRLRSRDLSVLLEGSGWAINARMRLSREQSRQFTRRPPYPSGSRLLRGGVRAWLWWVTVAAALLFLLHGCLYGFR